MGNATALQALVSESGVKLRKFPSDVLQAMRTTTEEVLSEFSYGDDLTKRIFSSFDAARRKLTDWSRVSHHAFLDARLKTWSGD